MTFSLTTDALCGLEKAQVKALFTKAYTYAVSKIARKTNCPEKNILLIPPDISRSSSFAGMFCDFCMAEDGKRIKAVMPSLGTHCAMSDSDIQNMYPNVAKELFTVHNYKTDTIPLGVINDIPFSVNKMLCDDDLSLIISIGQVVPHEVFGMSNYTKNIFIGCGGKDTIDKSHFASALFGIENILGVPDNPLRINFDKAYKQFAKKMAPILWIMTVTDNLNLRGVFIGSDAECFKAAAEFSKKINITVLNKRPKKIVTYMAKEKYRSTWIANKAIYRTRCAIADAGELVIIAPGLERFGEDPLSDAIIRKYGYRGRDFILDNLDNSDLQDNLSAAAHLIHGSSEGRFKITYCTNDSAAAPIGKKEIECVGFAWANAEEAELHYDVHNIQSGWNVGKDGGEYFFIENPALGLWRV